MQRKWLSRLLAVSVTVVMLVGSLGFSAAADSGFFVPYTSYEYNYYKESVAAPVSYVLEKAYLWDDIGLDVDFYNPTDMSFSGDSLYILDSGNSRILELDTDLQLKAIHKDFLLPADLSESGEDETVVFENAEGFYVYEDGSFLLADTQGQRILKITDGTVTQVITRPDSPSVDQEVPFAVRKVIVGSQNRIYALVESMNQGALTFDENGNFLTYFGSNRVKQTAEVISKYLWRRFMTEEQLKQMVSYTPINMVNFDMDNRGFMISVTQDNSSTQVTGTVRRLNYENNDVLNSPDAHYFGDLESDRKLNATSATALCDVDVDEDGFYVLLDSQRRRVFIYSDDGDFVSEFSLNGEQKGMMSNPVAVETKGGRVYVLDADKRCIHVFRPTDYAVKYRSALLSLESGDYDQSIDAWQELLDENTNNEIVYYGMGRVYDEAKDYKTAMEYFEKSKDQESYSFAFKEYRKIYIQDNFLWLAAIALVIIVGIAVAVKLLKKKLTATGDSAYTLMESKWLFPLYVQTHPADGFIQFKTRKYIRSWEMTFGFVIVWFLLRVLEFFGTGFIFNTNRVSDFNLFITMASTIGLYVLFVVANWAICTLIEGKGTLPEIMTTTAYSLLPYMVSMLLNTILSNFFAQDEGSFMTIITYIGLVWTLLVLFTGLSAIHEYSVGKTVVSILLTIFGMAVIIFLVILFYTLVTQTISFVVSVVQEILLRQ